jgi:hypothetical protein
MPQMLRTTVPMSRKWSREGVLDTFCCELYNNFFYSAKGKAAVDDDTDEDVVPKSANTLYVYLAL